MYNKNVFSQISGMSYAGDFGSGNKTRQNDPVFSLPGHAGYHFPSFLSMNVYDEIFFNKNLPDFFNSGILRNYTDSISISYIYITSVDGVWANL
jgi:hypothetical protein